MFGLKEECYDDRKIVPIYPCEPPCKVDYYELIELAVKSAESVRKTVERLFFMEDYCCDPERVRACLKEAICELKELRKYLDCLLEQFEPEYFRCDRVYPGLVRAFVISKFILQLFCYLLTLDFCKDEDELEFLIDSLRRSSIDADIILNELYIVHETFEGECK